MMAKGPIFAVALACLAALAGAAAPPPDGEAVLARALDEHTTALARERYALAAGPLLGAASRAQPLLLPVRLWARQDYVIAAACEPACGRLELRIIDRDGVAIAQVEGETPVLRVRPAATGQHTIEAAAPSCGARTCRIAVNVYAR